MTNPKEVKIIGSFESSYVLKGLIYVAEKKFHYSNGTEITIVRRLDFISYWLTKAIHGEAKLNDMANHIPEDYL
jgi:hypothetical protein